MKKVLLKILFVTLIPLAAQAQTGSTFGKNYVWQDSLSVNTTGRDSTFAIQWESVSIWCEDGDALVKIGAPDVGSWSSRKFVRLTEGMVMRFGPETKLVRLQFKGATGAVRFYFLGYKKSKQFN